MKGILSILTLLLAFAGPPPQGNPSGPTGGLAGLLSKLKPTGPMPPTSDYSGTVHFTWVVKGPYGWNRETWTAGIVDGVADCIGRDDDVNQGQLKVTPLSGAGLFTLHFDDIDPKATGPYSFDIACPTQTRPNQSSWSDFNTSYPQRGQFGQTISGSWSSPSDVDPINGQTGYKSMSWTLCYHCPPPAPPPPLPPPSMTPPSTTPPPGPPPTTTP